MNRYENVTSSECQDILNRMMYTILETEMINYVHNIILYLIIIL